MCRADPILNCRRNPGTAERLSALGALGLRPPHPGGDALLDDRPLELAEHRKHAEHRPPRRARGVKPLLTKKKFHSRGTKVVEKMDQILKRPTEPVDAPRHHEVELTKRGIPVELVESRPLLASLPTADAVVTVDLDHHVTQAIGRGAELTLLVLGRLVGGADPQIQRRAHGSLPRRPRK